MANPSVVFSTGTLTLHNTKHNTITLYTFRGSWELYCTTSYMPCVRTSNESLLLCLVNPTIYSAFFHVVCAWYQLEMKVTQICIPQ